MALDPYLARIVRDVAGLPADQVDERIWAYFESTRERRNLDVPTEDRRIGSGDGSFRVRLYWPPIAAPAPAFVWVHGGAFAYGDLEMPEADEVSRAICAGGDVLVVSVDYRRATGGVTWPVPHEDALAALRWTRLHAGELGVDPARISIGGASAGGALAATAVIHARDDGDPAVRSLVLAYPAVALDPPAHPSELVERLAALPAALGGPGGDYGGPLGRAMWASYLGDAIAHPGPHAVPDLADLRDLPTTLVVTCEYDGLAPQAQRFAHRLLDAGVPVRLVDTPGVTHGHLDLLWSLPPAERTIDLIIETILA